MRQICLYGYASGRFSIVGYVVSRNEQLSNIILLYIEPPNSHIEQKVTQVLVSVMICIPTARELYPTEVSKSGHKSQIYQSRNE